MPTNIMFPASLFNERIRKLILRAQAKVFPFPEGWLAESPHPLGHAIKQLLISKQACVVSRFGSVELEVIVTQLSQGLDFNAWERIVNCLSWKVRYRSWTPRLRQKLRLNAGFFPTDNVNLERFVTLYLENIPEIDILGSWLQAETLLSDYIRNTMRIELEALEPYLSPEPWSSELRGRSVLVIHPFAESIKEQYGKRDVLFEDPNVLPEFKLLTLKAIQSAGDEETPYKDWFQALDAMRAEIDKLDFDVAIIGAGAYGLPLAVHIKNLGRQAIHLGGATQMLFGVYGQRWISDPVRKNLIHHEWVRPKQSERIAGASKIENACYW